MHHPQCCAIAQAECTAGTFKEILSSATDTSQKEVTRSFNIIKKSMGDELGMAQQTAHVKGFMRRFCSQLGLKHRDVMVAEEVALAACPRDGRRVALLVVGINPSSWDIPSLQNGRGRLGQESGLAHWGFQEWSPPIAILNKESPAGAL